ncbi:MAG: PilZ domain-containing protein [Deltaproteobacteria bacterium]|jgi:hypothetical protein|nr:PilZ domain-containing protein [Deltaproteobacteria bacterium]
MDERRRHQRYDIQLGAEVNTADRSFSAGTRDVSASGACLESPYPLDETSFVMLNLHLVVDGIEDADFAPLTVRAQVQWTAELEDLSAAWRHLAGLRFDGMNDDAKNWLEQVIDRAD